ncbi:MAG: lanthionine synthetase LanC family protein [Gammaproteobacteria bacterium]
MLPPPPHSLVPTEPSWSSLLRGASRDAAFARVEAIADKLQSLECDDASLARGSAGVALFFAEFARATDDRRAAEIAVVFLERALRAEAQAPRRTSLLEGRLGVRWALAHVAELLDLGLGVEDPNRAMDSAVLDALSAPRWAGQYDLVGGLVGLGVYGLGRVSTGSGAAIVSRAIDHIVDLATRSPDGALWWTPSHLLTAAQRAAAPSGYVNLGMAHGIPGVLAFLGYADCAGMVPPAVQTLLQEGVRWLLKQRLSGANQAFPSWVDANGIAAPARPAWCYGDAGIAAALLAAGYGREAGAMARNVAERARGSAWVVDGGLCHGAAGLGHVLNRIYRVCRDEVVANAARDWLAEAQSLRTNGSGLLEGDAGVGLALLAASSNWEPIWDAVLLISSPAPRTWRRRE